MKKGKLAKRGIAIWMAAMMVCSSAGLSAYASEITDEDSGTVSENSETVDDSGLVYGSEGTANEDVSAQGAEQSSEETGSAGEVADEVDNEIGELQLVYGNEDLADKDAMVLLILGDGFTSDEQETFYSKAKETAEYIMECSPYDEFTDVFKIYALGTVSNESGARGDKAGSEAEAEADERDTYFGATFWSYGAQRLVSLSDEGDARLWELHDEYLPLADYNLMLVNSTTYGGSGGDYCIASLTTSSLEMMLHEMGHTIANLSDEYYAAGYEEELANLTQESDPDLVPWTRFVGKNGIGVYDWGGVADCGWYVPSTSCKMQYLGAKYEFCEVCKEELRKAFCAGSNVTRLFFQTYADEFTKDTAWDMSEYFILRKGDAEITGDELGDDLTLTYYDEEGNKLESAPSNAGTYTVKAEFEGNDEYDACSAEGSYTIDNLSITLKASSKAQDGNPVDLTWEVDYDKEFSVDIYYYGYQYYGNTSCAEYEYYLKDIDTDTYSVYEYLTDPDSFDYGDPLAYDEYETTGGPTKPGSYEVTLTVYDEGGDWIGDKTVEFDIYFKTNDIVDNNDDDYWAAYEYTCMKNIVILGEGFTEEEQDKFDALSEQLAATILDTEPFKETQIYYNFISVTSDSAESGIGTEPKNTVFRMTYDKDGKLTTDYSTTYEAYYLAYNVSDYIADYIIIVNDENATESSAYAYNYGTYSYFHSIAITPDEAGMEYAAAELLNHLVLDEVGYRAGTEEAKEAQRLALIKALHSDNASSPIILSRAYDETFKMDGTAFDLAPYFESYYDGKLLSGLELELTYYADDNGQPGEELSGAPSDAGTYHVKAQTKVDYVDEDGDSWTYYVPEGADPDDEDSCLWFALSRGWTTYTISIDDGLSDVKASDGNWYYYKDNKVDTSYTGLAKNKNGWYYVKNGKVDFNYTGFSTNKNGKWYVEKGQVKFNKSSVIKDTAGALGEKGAWYYVVKSKVQTDYTGVANYKNAKGWWYVKNGKVNFNYTGFSTNKNGKWYVEKGQVKFNKSSVIKDTAGALGTKGAWYYVVKSKVQTGYTGVANHKNANGWWYVKNGKVDFSFHGIASNANGKWYIKNGKVDFSFTGTVKTAKGTYKVVKGKVQ